MAPPNPRRRVGLIGYPLGHSISPVFQQAALDYHGIAATYELWETPAEDVGEVVAGLRAPDCLGANVTIPHKLRVMPLLDEIDRHARAIGAVNTIVNVSGRLIGRNTDAAGCLRALTERGNFDPAGRPAVVIGAGGAARAVVFGLLWHGASPVTIVNRTRARAEALAADARSATTASIP